MLKKNINIRATTLKEFWCNEYENSIYMWEGAKNNLTLDEIDNLEIATMKDLFVTKVEITHAHRDCRRLYRKYLTILSNKLNEIHSLDLPESFWTICFGYWLFRYISNIYEKYAYLSMLDIDKTSIALLDKTSFFIPHDQTEYVHFFCSDFGVQQIVSQYYYLFKNKDFPIVARQYTLNMKQKNAEHGNLNIGKFLSFTKWLLLRPFIKTVSVLIRQKIVLLKTDYSADIINRLLINSKGRIRSIHLPEVNISQNQINRSDRRKLSAIDTNGDLEHFMTHSFYNCIPKIFLEHFRAYYDAFSADIEKRNFTHIVSSGWIGRSNIGLYCAIAKNNGIKLICQEHAAGSDIVKYTMRWIDQSVADVFLTTGWGAKESNVIAGGFNKTTPEYHFDQAKTDVLFITHVRFPYLMQFGRHATNTAYINELKLVNDFINFLPDKIREKFVLRLRKANSKHFWDNELAWEVERKGITIDLGNFAKSILRSRIVIIDHITTGLAEILIMKAPFLLMLNSHVIIEEKYKPIFNDLINCNVIHYSPKSAVKFLSTVYGDVQEWWRSETVQVSVNRFLSSFLADPSKTTDYLLSLV